MAVDERSQNWCMVINNEHWDNVKSLRRNKNVEKYVAQEEANDEGESQIVLGVKTTKPLTRDKIKTLLPRGFIRKPTPLKLWHTSFERCISLMRRIGHTVTYRVGRIDRYSTIPNDHEMLGKNLVEDFGLKIYNLYPWQHTLLRELHKKAHERKSIWVKDQFGNTGKTSFARYISELFSERVFSGFATVGSKIKHSLMKENEKSPVDIVLFDIPKANKNAVPYDTIEEIKNGTFMSTYRGSRVVELKTIPHVVCFASFEPNPNAMNSDRWTYIEATRPYEEVNDEEVKIDF